MIKKQEKKLNFTHTMKMCDYLARKMDQMLFIPIKILQVTKKNCTKMFLLKHLLKKKINKKSSKNLLPQKANYSTNNLLFLG